MSIGLRLLGSGTTADSKRWSPLSQPRAMGLSLRRRLILLVAASLVPFLAYKLSRQFVEYHEAVATTSRENQGLAQGMSRLLEQQLQSYIKVLQAVAESSSLQTGDIDHFRTRVASELAPLFPGATLSLVRRDGQELVNTDLPSGAPLPVRSGMASSRQVFATGHPNVTNIFAAASDGRAMVAIDVPVKRDDGSVAYVLSLSPSLDTFADTIRSQHLPASWMISVFDGKGIGVARVRNSDGFVGQSAPPNMLGLPESQRAGTRQSISADGVPLTYSFSHGKTFGWWVAIVMPTSELTRPALYAALRSSATDVGLLAFCMILVFFAARHIANPIETLHRFARAVPLDLPPDRAVTDLAEVNDIALALTIADQERRASRQAEKTLRDGIESMPEGFALYDDVDRLVICNESYKRLFPNQRDPIALVPRSEDALRDGMVLGHDATAGGTGDEWVTAHMHNHRHSGSRIEQWLADGRCVLASNQRLPNGWTAGLRVDITSHKNTERHLIDAQRRADQALVALNTSEESLKRAQRLAHMGSFIADLRTGKAELSDETFRILGVPREGYDTAVMNFVQSVHPDDRAVILAARQRALEGVRPEPSDFRIVRPDGIVRQINSEYEIVRIERDEDSRPLFLVGTFHDVTESRQVEEQLRQAQKMEAIGNLTGGMAHDFNNLLGVIIGNLDMARLRIGGDTELEAIVGEAHGAAWHGADLTRRLLAFARRQPLRPVRINVNEMITDTVRLLGRILGENIDVSVELGGDVSAVIADPAQLEGSLINLATNARDAMPKGGRLFIRTSNCRLDAEYVAAHVNATEGEYVMIEASDSGIGMSAETVSRIFEPFFTTKDTGKGSGLGLSMVFGFLRQSGGHIRVDSELGVGTTFRLYLLRETSAAVPREAAEAPVAKQGAGEVVLVVEDNPAMRRIVLRQLRELGYRALESERAVEAIDALQRERVDLLLTDIVMPGGLDGVELAHLAIERWPTLKVVLTSGFPQTRIDGSGDPLSGLPLLSKPYGRAELANVLRKALEG